MDSLFSSGSWFQVTLEKALPVARARRAQNYINEFFDPCCLGSWGWKGLELLPGFLLHQATSTSPSKRRCNSSWKSFAVGVMVQDWKTSECLNLSDTSCCSPTYHPISYWLLDALCVAEPASWWHGKRGAWSEPLFCQIQLCSLFGLGRPHCCDKHIHNFMKNKGDSSSRTLSHVTGLLEEDTSVQRPCPLPHTIPECILMKASFCWCYWYGFAGLWWPTHYNLMVVLSPDNLPKCHIWHF